MRRSCSRRLQFLVARSALTWFIEQHLRLSASDFVHATLTSEEFAIWFAMLQLSTLTSTEVVVVTTAPAVLACEEAVVPAPAVLVIGFVVTLFVEVAQKLRPTLEGTVHAPQVSWQIV
mmetsp:Transcript_51618/g.99764  ORF Transcript_51618/g.99764 Transcript_51618/m.99764 type:complete len:118 (-) Transcript_51618:997-1350(-)